MLLGDRLALTFRKMGLKSCFQCQRRQAKLNQLHTQAKAVAQRYRGNSYSGPSDSSRSPTSQG